MLKRWGHEAKQDPEGEHEQHFVREVFKRLPTDLRMTRRPSALDRSVVLPTAEGQGAKIDEGPSVVLPPVAEAHVMGAADTSNTAPPTLPPISASGSMSTTATLQVPSSSSPPYPQGTLETTKTTANYRATCGFPTLFDSFPRSLVVCGDAERLVREVRSLIKAMEKDGVDLDVVWSRDACHDILMMNELWWDRKVIEETWEGIAAWAEGFKNSSASPSPRIPDKTARADVALIEV